MTTAKHILVVDDEPAICDLVKNYLTLEGFQVSTAENGEAMRRVMALGQVDLVILDLMLPGEDGLSLTRYLRDHSDVAIIILTGKGETVDRVVGLELGADDYLAKPFDLRELLARVRSVLRRAGARRKQATEETVVRFAGWKLDFSTRRLLSPNNVETPLTTGEFDLLAVFVTHPNRVLSRDELLDLTRGRAAGPFDRAIDVQVGRLRQKIEPDAQHPTLIKTVRAAGYLFTPPVKR
ncbi:MAG TPA: response regulator [Burkholderiales bacterium]|nr:response regulator [Burkholderiales bacterium]